MDCDPSASFARSAICFAKSKLFTCIKLENAGSLRQASLNFLSSSGDKIRKIEFNNGTRESGTNGLGSDSTMIFKSLRVGSEFS